MARIKEIFPGRNQLGLEIVRVLFIKGKNQVWLARKVGCTKTYLSLVINGKRKPSSAFVQKVANALEMDVEQLRRLVLIAS